jgi:hypothetical protein
MATTQYAIAGAVPNRTLTATLNNLDTLAVEYTADTVVETIANSGVYTLAFGEAAAISGTWRLIIVDSATALGVANWSLTFAGTDAEYIDAVEFTTTAAGAATETKQDTIIAAITPLTTVYTAQLTESTIALIRGDAYDGISNAKLSWTPTKNIDAATGFNFTIRDSKDVVILDQDTTGVTVTGSGTTIEVELLVAATELLDPAGTIYTFDVEVVFSATSHWTISKGLVSITKDVSRG